MGLAKVTDDPVSERVRGGNDILSFSRSHSLTDRIGHLSDMAKIVTLHGNDYNGA